MKRDELISERMTEEVVEKMDKMELSDEPGPSNRSNNKPAAKKKDEQKKKGGKKK